MRFQRMGRYDVTALIGEGGIGKPLGAELRGVNMKTIVSMVLLVGLAPVANFAQAMPCKSLSSLSLPETTITMAQTVAPGALIVPGFFRPDAWADLPDFCRVVATLKPSSDSDITIEVWLPSEGWNGKYQAVGNGGWAGFISHAGMAEALRRGYATSSTDTGHTGNPGDASFAFGHAPSTIQGCARERVTNATFQRAARPGRRFHYE